jgi:hypothetical protein
MATAIPPDLVVFLISVTVFFVIGLPLFTRTFSLPSRVEFEAIAENDLSPEQSRYFAALDGALSTLNYLPKGNWKPTNMTGRALLRLYFNPVDPAIVTVNLLTTDASNGADVSMNYIEIVTKYRDGTILSTRNADVSDVLDRLPGHVVIERRGLRDPARLKLVHDSKSAELLTGDPIHLRPEEFEEAFNDHHRRWCAHLLDRGYLRPDSDDPETLRPTVKTGIRGIINFINPLADNFTAVRFLLGLLFGLAAPGAGLVWLRGPGADLVAGTALSLGLDPRLVLTLSMGLLLTLSGVVVGLIFGGKSFIWSFLFTYVLLRLIASTGLIATAVLCVWTAVVADQTSRWRQAKDRLV